MAARSGQGIEIDKFIMIPKIIHYCWFGRGVLPELAVRCIESWKKYLPDYQIKEWNEDNFDIDMFAYVREAYDARKFAFVSDVVRLYALVQEGGIYMDTDVEVLKPLDCLLQYDAVSGFETDIDVPTGLMAAKKNHPLFVELLNEYDGIHFIKENGEFDYTTNVDRITRICLKYGLIRNNQFQTVNGFTFLPTDYLCPKSHKTGKIRLTDNSLTIHHFAGSWQSPYLKYKYRIINKLPKGLVEFCVKLKNIIRR